MVSLDPTSGQGRGGRGTGTVRVLDRTLPFGPTVGMDVVPSHHSRSPSRPYRCTLNPRHLRPWPDPEISEGIPSLTPTDGEPTRGEITSGPVRGPPPTPHHPLPHPPDGGDGSEGQEGGSQRGDRGNWEVEGHGRSPTRPEKRVTSYPTEDVIKRFPQGRQEDGVHTKGDGTSLRSGSFLHTPHPLRDPRPVPLILGWRRRIETETRLPSCQGPC